MKPRARVRASRMVAGLGLVLFGALHGIGLAAPTFAQLPSLPFFGDDKDKKPDGAEKPKSDETEDETQAEDPKGYPKPEPAPLPEGEPEKLSGVIALVPFAGIVNPGMGEFTLSAIERAQRESAQAVLIELDTPGGLVSTTEKIVQSILASKVPVIVFVSPSGAHAASAGTLITLAAHVAAMAPATRIGAAHPVTGDGKDPEAGGSKHMGRKVENDLAALIEGIAQARGRNVAWAIDAVRRSISATAQHALEMGVIDLVAADRAELFKQLDGKVLMVGKRKVQLSLSAPQVVEYQLSLRQRLLNLLANPGIAMVLGLLGVIGIMVEIYHPGMIAPGVMGVLCILCSLIAMEQLPIDVGGVILVVAGIGLIIAELFTSTYGALGILGAIGLVVGLIMLVDLGDPNFAVDRSFALGLRDVLPMVLMLGAFIVYLSTASVRASRNKPVTGREALVGAYGLVLQPVDRSAGMILLQGEYWQARSLEPISEKEEVEVVGIQGLELAVRRRPRLPPTGVDG